MCIEFSQRCECCYAKKSGRRCHMKEDYLVMGVPLPIPGLEYQIECILLSECDGTNTVDRVKE